MPRAPRLLSVLIDSWVVQQGREKPTISDGCTSCQLPDVRRSGVQQVVFVFCICLSFLYYVQYCEPTVLCSVQFVRVFSTLRRGNSFRRLTLQLQLNLGTDAVSSTPPAHDEATLSKLSYRYDRADAPRTPEGTVRSASSDAQGEGAVVAWMAIRHAHARTYCSTVCVGDGVPPCRWGQYGDTRGA